MSVAMVGTGVAKFAGISAPGAISVSGLKAGDRVIWIYLIAPTGSSYQFPNGVFEAVISNDDEIQQKAGAGDLSGIDCEIVFVRQVG